MVSLILIPWALALSLVRGLFDTYGALSLVQIAIPFLFGAGWGIAQVLFGLSVERLGLGQAYAIIVGLGAVLGTLVPLFVQHRGQIGGIALVEILSGVARNDPWDRSFCLGRADEGDAATPHRNRRQQADTAPPFCLRSYAE